MMIGPILIMAFSCQIPTIKDPVQMYELRMSSAQAKVARRNLDIKSDPRTVAEKIEPFYIIEFNELPNSLMCFSLETYLKRIKPKIKEGAQAYYDYRN